MVAGDIVYDNVPMMQFEAGDAAREAWIASLDAIAAVEDLVNGMMELHGDRDNSPTLWISARAEVGRRA